MLCCSCTILSQWECVHRKAEVDDKRQPVLSFFHHTPNLILAQGISIHHSKMAAVEGPLQDPSLALCATPSVPPHDRWAKALASLNKHDKLQLSQNITNKDRLEVLREIIDITAEKKRRCIQKAWKFKRRDGKVVIIRDLLEKIAVWVQKFKEVGDIAVSFDPVHAALPWAAVRFLISLSIDDVQNFGAMTEGIEKIAMLITRCEVLERLYLKPGVTDDTGFEDSLIGLYVAILKFQSNAIRFYGKNTTSKQRLIWLYLI